jgi:hypothetical protein
MSRLQQAVLDRVPQKTVSPALRQIRQLAKEPGTEMAGHVALQPVQEVLSVWSIRLWNATLRARRFVGLADLVRALMKLSPDEQVEQFALKSGQKTGLVFFVAKTKEPIGAVISVRTEAAERRSYRNWEEANGMTAPVLSAGSSAR